jgi:hypothetical protein
MTESTARPVVWVHRDDPIWPAVAERYRQEKGGKTLVARGSAYATGVGAFVPSAWLEAEADRQGANATWLGG